MKQEYSIFSKFCELLNVYGFSGIDVNPEISLGEYSCLSKKIDDEICVIYNQDYTINLYDDLVSDGFYILYFTEADMEESFDLDVDFFLTYTGYDSKEEWLNAPLENRIYDLESCNAFLNDMCFGKSKLSMAQILDILNIKHNILGEYSKK